jgi:hypothetical protein
VTKTRIKWAGNVTGMGERRNTYKMSFRKPERKRPLRRPRHRQKGDIKI